MMQTTSFEVISPFSRFPEYYSPPAAQRKQATCRWFAAEREARTDAQYNDICVP
jgi:hypothetical protein